MCYRWRFGVHHKFATRRQWVGELESAFPTSINFPFTSLHFRTPGMLRCPSSLDGRTVSSLPCSWNACETMLLPFYRRYNGTMLTLDLI